MNSIKRVVLGDLCSFKNGGTPDKGVSRYFQGVTPWITGADITGTVVKSARNFITEEAIEHSATNLVPAGTVLLVTRTSVGKAAVAGIDLCFSQDITALIPDPSRLMAPYLLQFLRSQENHLSSRSRGATIKGITRDVVAHLEIPLPSLCQQQRIAEVLDRADALRGKRRAVLAQFDKLTQSIFFDMFGDPIQNPMSWPTQCVSVYVERFQGGRSIKSESRDNIASRNRVLRISAVTQMKFLASESKPVRNDYNPPVDHFVRDGDLLFSRANTTELVGAVAFVDNTPPNLLLPDKLWRFVWRQPKTVEPLFVWSLFQTRALRRQISERATGTSGSMKNISQRKLLNLTTIHPPLGLQSEYARRVRAIERLKSAQRTSLSVLDELFASLQHRAFRGEL